MIHPLEVTATVNGLTLSVSVRMHHNAQCSMRSASDAIALDRIHRME